MKTTRSSRRLGLMRRVGMALVFSLALLAAACGNKGDLYLPDKSPPPEGSQG